MSREPQTRAASAIQDGYRIADQVEAGGRADQRASRLLLRVMHQLAESWRCLRLSPRSSCLAG